MISVLIPAYNCRDLLPQALDSVLGQEEFDDWEAVVVDDGSDDDTFAVARDYTRRDSRIHAVSIPHGGLSVARNAALAHSTGDRVVWLDGDDKLHPRALADMDRIARQSHADVVHAMMVRGTAFRPARLTGRYFVLDGSIAWEEILYQHVLNNSLSGKMFRRELFDGYTFTPGGLYEDLEASAWLYVPGVRVAVTMDPVYFYRDNPGSLVNTWRPERLDVLRVTTALTAAARSRGPESLAAARNRRFAALFNMFLLASDHGETRTAQYCWRLLKAYRGLIVTDRRSRPKNKLGALLSFMGRRPTIFVHRLLGI